MAFNMAEIIKLSERLKSIVGFINPGSNVIDVGTDHGHLPVYLAQNNLARHIMASDISGRSLEAARRTASKYGLRERIEFIEAPGLRGIYEEDVDTVVISGLGGETIAKIISDAPWTKRCETRLILQPQSKIEDLCIFLRSSGYVYKDAEIALDNAKYYIIIYAQTGTLTSEMNPEIELYSILAKKRAPLFSSFLDSLILKNQSNAMSQKEKRKKRYDVLQSRLNDLLALRKAFKVWQM
jgi:tRNA (adenine22-N1)-methyltransferase